MYMNDLATYRSQLAVFLTDFLTQQQELLIDQPFSSEVFTVLKPYCVAGKMLRGGLLLSTFEALSRQPIKLGQLAVAAAQELTESALLIHDDIIDQDEKRRGGPAIHTHFRQRAAAHQYSHPQQYGESLGICVGDIVFFSCYQLLAQAELPAAIKIDLIQLFSQKLSTVALAEMADVDLAVRSNSITKSEIMRMYEGKTSTYSFSLPLLAGAILAEKTTLLKQLDEIGRVLGLIFQIKDDELGLFGNTDQTGKPVGADVREGKKTLFYYYAHELIKGDDQTKLAHIFGNSEVSATEVEWLQKVLQTTGVTAAVDQELHELHQQASNLISNVVDKALAIMLENLLNYHLSRQH